MLKTGKWIKTTVDLPEDLHVRYGKLKEQRVVNSITDVVETGVKVHEGELLNTVKRFEHVQERLLRMEKVMEKMYLMLEVVKAYAKNEKREDANSNDNNAAPDISDSSTWKFDDS